MCSHLQAGCGMEFMSVTRSQITHESSQLAPCQVKSELPANSMILTGEERENEAWPLLVVTHPVVSIIYELLKGGDSDWSIAQPKEIQENQGPALRQVSYSGARIHRRG